MQVHGFFKADSAYSFFGIGNYFGDSLTAIIQTGSGNSNFAYYLIDDVCISADPDECGIPLFVANPKPEDTFFSISPQPADRFVTLQFKNTVTNGMIEVKSISGRAFRKDVIQNTKKTGLNTSALIPGMYFVKLSTAGKVYRSKLIISR